jgi:iron complex outermembrane recepter protein
MLSAYEENNIDGLFYDNDAAPPHLTDVRQFTKSTSFQNEVYLNGTLGNSGAAGSLDWTTGLFVFNLHSQEYPLNILSTAFLASNYAIFADQFTRSYAAYGQATYSITDTTRVTAGARFTEDSRDFSGRQIAITPNPTAAGTVLATGFGTSSENRPTYRVAVDQALTKDILAYASFSTGFKAGTFNLTSIKAPAVGPETIKAYEVGIKSELFDHTLRLNAAAFYYNYNGVQLTTTQIGVTTYFNAANSHIKGGEVELTFAPRIPVGDLELNAGVSYLDAQYTSFPNGQISKPLPTGGNSQVIGDLSGNTMIRAPKWSGNVSANYTLPIGPGDLGFYANYYYTTLYYWDPDNRLKQPAYGLLNSDVSYSFGRDRQYKVKFYGKNLTNKEYFVYQSAASLASVAAAGDPRTYGVGFEVKF